MLCLGQVGAAPKFSCLQNKNWHDYGVEGLGGSRNECSSLSRDLSQEAAALRGRGGRRHPLGPTLGPGMMGSESSPAVSVVGTWATSPRAGEREPRAAAVGFMSLSLCMAGTRPRGRDATGCLAGWLACLPDSCSTLLLLHPARKEGAGWGGERREGGPSHLRAPWATRTVSAAPQAAGPGLFGTLAASRK